MGSIYSSRKHKHNKTGIVKTDDVNLNDFKVLRSIGKGSFGKVCIVKKKDTKKLYAMKYMNKKQCIERDVLRNVNRELEILMTLNFRFIVNLWFSFQDEEYFFMVMDIMLGGDFRYHLQRKVHFDENAIKLYFCELALALDYLKRNHVIHRDIKPDNVLLDKYGHAHLTDFNVAVRLESDNDLVTSISGTRPYMAPEIFNCLKSKGYSYAVDWWSLGILGYELIYKKRPYDFHQNASSSDMLFVFQETDVFYSKDCSKEFTSILKKLLEIDPDKRISTLKQFKKHSFLNHLDFDRIFRKEYQPNFIPSARGLNCDPRYELEEMIIESNPLHKKHKQLAKKQSLIKYDVKFNDKTMVLLSKYKSYNREQILECCN